MGLYADADCYTWFITEYNKLNIGNPDMGKGCVRLKNLEKIPYELIGKLTAKISVDA